MEDIQDINPEDTAEDTIEVSAESTEAAVEEIKFKSLKEATNAYKELSSTSDEVLNATISERDSLTEAVNALELKIKNLEETLTSKDSEIELLANKVGELEKQEMDANKKAAEIAASVSVDPVEVLDNDKVNSKTQAELWTEYNKISDPVEKTDFYRAYLR